MHTIKAGSLSQTTKAVKLRNSRVKRMNEKRFNTPLRAFLEHKYPAIYTEYAELYELLNTAHPQRKKLVTSSTFRRWMITNPPTVIPQVCDDILTQALQETFASETPGQNSTQHVPTSGSAGFLSKQPPPRPRHSPPNHERGYSKCFSAEHPPRG